MKKIKVGSIVNTHGLKGEVKVKVITDFPEIRFAKKASVFMQSNEKEMVLTIKSVRLQKDMLLIQFDGYDDINQVEPWKGSALYIKEDQLQELDEEEAYFHELLDSEVYDMQRQYIGKVCEIIETGAHVVLRVAEGERMILLPFVKRFVKEFDKENKRMYVELVEGL